MSTNVVKVTEVTVQDPDTLDFVELEVWKDVDCGGIFAIDSSYLDQVKSDQIPSPFTGELLDLPEDEESAFDSGSLEELYHLQASLNSKCGMDTLGMGKVLRDTELDPSADKEHERVLGYAGKMLHQYNNAMRSEVQELEDCTSWKHWYAEAKAGDQFKIMKLQNARVEIIDMLFFWMSMAQILGLQPSDIYQLYRKKLDINHKRQDENRSQAEHADHESENESVV